MPITWAGDSHKTDWSTETRTVVRGRQTTSYQQSRNEGCLPGKSTIVSSDKRLLCYDSVRQHDSYFLPEKAGWGGGRDPFTTTLHGSLGNPVLVSDQKHNYENQTHTREIQCDRRQSVPPEHSIADRMVNMLDCPQSDIFEVTHVGPVCNTVQQNTAPFCVSSSGPQSVGGGCVVSGMEHSVCLNVSSVQTDPPSTEQNQEHQLHDNSDSSSVASEILVQQPVRTSQGKTTSTSVQDGSHISGQGNHLTPQPRNSPPPHMEIIRESIRDRNFSEYTTTYISNAKKESTNRVCILKWRKAFNWCQ